MRVGEPAVRHFYTSSLDFQAKTSKMADSKTKFVVTDIFSRRPDLAMDYALDLAIKTAEKENFYPEDAKICILYRDGESVELAARYHVSGEEKFALNWRWNFVHEGSSNEDMKKEYTCNSDLVITTDEFLEHVSSCEYDLILICCDNVETKEMIVENVDDLDYHLYHKCKEHGQIEYIVSSL